MFFPSEHDQWEIKFWKNYYSFRNTNCNSYFEIKQLLYDSLQHADKCSILSTKIETTPNYTKVSK